MNRKQYFAVSWFFLALMFLLIWWHMNVMMPTLGIFNGISGSISAGGVYQAVKTALVFTMILLCFPLFVLFQLLAWLEPKKK